jgi:hypothetical protein
MLTVFRHTVIEAVFMLTVRHRVIEAVCMLTAARHLIIKKPVCMLTVVRLEIITIFWT